MITNRVIQAWWDKANASGSDLMRWSDFFDCMAELRNEDTTDYVVNRMAYDDLPEYADNLAAITGGLVGGEFYRQSDGSVMQALPLPLDTPAIEILADLGDGVGVGWTLDYNAVGSILQRSTDDATWSTVYTAGTGVIVYNDFGVTPGTLYYYKVKNLGDGITHTDSLYSASDSVTPSGT